MANCTQASGKVTIGLDLGDKYSKLHMLAADGEVLEEARLKTTADAIRGRFSALAPARVAIEVGTHSPWVSRLLEECGHEVLVANPRRLRLISENDRKSDDLDAELLARVARLDPKLLSPVKHRGPQAQADLALVRARDALVRTRTILVNMVRGSVKSLGSRLPSCDPRSFSTKVRGSIPEALEPALSPALDTIHALTLQIGEYDKKIDALCATKYKEETKRLRQPKGVGPLTSLAFLLILESPGRFKKSRDVGAYLGLVPRRQESGAQQPQLRITKAGDKLLRRLLVSSAHYILGPFGEDSDLRRHGEAIAQRGGKNAKKRAVVAVARKLAVLLHRLWVSGEDYEALRNSKSRPRRKGRMKLHSTN